METAVPLPAKPPLKFMTVATAAKILGVSQRWMYETIRKRLGPHVLKVGSRNMRIAEHDFEEWCRNPPRQARPRRKRKIAP